MNFDIMYLWLDDVRPLGGEGTSYIGLIQDYECVVAHSVNQAKMLIEIAEHNGYEKFILSLDHDLGDYASDGGDGYKLVEWLIETGRNTNNYRICCHSMNPVGQEHILGLYDRYWPPFNGEDFFGNEEET